MAHAVRLIALLLLIAASGAANGVTYQEALTSALNRCAYYAANSPSAGKYCHVVVHEIGNASSATGTFRVQRTNQNKTGGATVGQCHGLVTNPFTYCVGTGSPGTAYTWTSNPPPGATCNVGEIHGGSGGQYAGESPNGNSCLDGCAYSFNPSHSFSDICIGSGSSQTCFHSGTYTNTGNTCTAEDDEPAPDDECVPLGAGGFTYCPSDGDCFRTPSGKKVCPDRPGPDCALASDGAACIGTDPPADEYESPPDRVEYCEDDDCEDVRVAGRNDEGDDDEEEEENDDDRCPPGDEDCEEDDDSDDIEASDSGCETQTPTCSDTGAVECQILYRTHRTKCEIEHSNKLLEQFEQKAVGEQRETNAKLKLMLERDLEASRKVIDELRANGLETKEMKIAITEGQRRLDQLTTDASSANVNATQATTASVDGVAAEVQELRQVFTAATSTAESSCMSAPPCTGHAVDCSILVQTWITGCQTKEAIEGIEGGSGSNEQPEWTQVEPGDPGAGVTGADMARASVQSIGIGVGDINSTGFLGGGSCPVFPELTVGGMAWQIDSQLWCDFLTVIRAVLMLAGAWATARILLGG